MVKLFLVLSLLCSTAFAQKQAVVILSEAQNLELRDGKTFTTGNYLNELTIPLMGLIDAGFIPVYVTPTGKKPNLDADSNNIKYFKNDAKLFERAQNLFKSIGDDRNKLRGTKDLSELDISKVAVIFVPGGHAPMIDLVVNKELGAFLRKAQSKKITTALICHGPIALISSMENPQGFIDLLKAGKTKEANAFSKKWNYRQYLMTIFSNAEERVAESTKLKGLMPYYPQDAFYFAGAKVSVKQEWTSNVVVDRELITAQNPNSVDEFTETVLRALKK